jgi:uncharacterized protein HemX
VSDTDKEIKDAIDALQKAEELLTKLDRGGIITKLEELREAIEALPQVQLDMRIARMRLTARLTSDPDKTPVQGLPVKGQSSHSIARVEPRLYRDDEKP